MSAKPDAIRAIIEAQREAARLKAEREAAEKAAEEKRLEEAVKRLIQGPRGPV